jgi:hypothetical protein
MLFTTENISNFTIFLFFLLIFLTIIPALSMFGHIFTREGRENLKLNPFLGVYYIIFIIYAVCYWFFPYYITAFTGMGEFWKKFLYGALCLVPILEKSLPN